MLRRVGIAVGSVALLAALAWPAVAPGELDSLPMSAYPMFAHPRSGVTRLVVAVNVDDGGTEHRLDPRQVGGTDQPMQAMMTLRQAITDGTTAELCREIAGRADHAGTVEIATVSVDAVDWYSGNEEPIDRTVHESCMVEPTP